MNNYIYIVVMALVSYTIRIPKSAKKEREPKDQLSLYA